MLPSAPWHRADRPRLLTVAWHLLSPPDRTVGYLPERRHRGKAADEQRGSVLPRSGMQARKLAPGTSHASLACPVSILLAISPSGGRGMRRASAFAHRFPNRGGSPSCPAACPWQGEKVGRPVLGG